VSLGTTESTPNARRKSRRRAIPVWLALLAISPIAIAEPPPQTKGPTPTPPGGEPAKRHLVTKRGEIVDYYCYIEKGLKGPAHRECGVKCVSGDVCMGLLTDEGDLYMLSVNHIRAMTPNAFQGIPDPFHKARGLIAERVDLTGYAMERKGQRIIEIMDVHRADGAPR
jgi:hypothetical protein